MTEATATLIGGTFLVFLCQVLKRAFHLSGNAMRWVAVGASIVVAGGAMLWQGELLFSDPETLLTGGLAMLGLSQIIYGAVKEKMNLSETGIPTGSKTK